MRIDIYKLTSKGETYLGFQERAAMPNNGDTIYFLGHYYKIMDTREQTTFVKFIN